MISGIHQFDLTGRTAIITGGSKGLGRSMAEGLASAGADVMLVSRNLDQAQSTADSIAKQFGHKAIAFAADVTQPAQVEAMVATALRDFGRIDILINNAGVNIRGPIDSLSLEQFQQVMQVNVTGPWLCSRAVVPHMKKAGRGRIINLASTLGLVGLALRTPYASSKGAVVQMTRTLALELAPHQRERHLPRPVSHRDEHADREHAGWRQGDRGDGDEAAGRRLEEIQGAAIFLASDASSFVTGSTLVVDGGWTGAVRHVFPRHVLGGRIPRMIDKRILDAVFSLPLEERLDFFDHLRENLAQRS